MARTTESRLQELIDSSVGDAPGILLGVHAPWQALEFEGAAGQFSRESGRSLSPSDSFRIASMSKTFTGVLTAQLIEQEVLNPASPVAQYLPAGIAGQVPVQSGCRVEDIRVEHLLQHRAGFNDFATSQAWFEEIAADPGRFRAPQEIASWALGYGELVGAPGAQYHYSDTGYVLLGLMLEEVTGTPYHRLCRENIFEPLQMQDTWLEGHEDPRGELSHPYVVMGGEYIDALQINGSCDWAGGGHVSTLSDIRRFLRGLFHGRLFADLATLDRFLDGPQESKEGFYYGMGVGRKQIHGLNLWGHLGHWGSFMYYCPERRLSLAGTLNYDQADHNDFIARVLSTLLQV